MAVDAALPAEIAELRDRALAFAREELQPAERRIAERGAVDPDELEELRRKAAAGEFRKRRRAEAKEEVLAALPEGT